MKTRLSSLNPLSSIFLSFFVTVAITSCGGGGSTSLESGEGTNSNGKINATIVKTIEVPIVYEFLFTDVYMDGDDLFLFGGFEYDPNAVDVLNGNPAFSEKILNYNLITDQKIELQMNASNGALMEDGSLSNGRAKARVNKVGSKTFLIYGGYVNVNNVEIADFGNETITKIDSNGLIISRSVALDNGDTYFFGFRDSSGFPTTRISKYDAIRKDIIQMNASMGLARDLPVVRKLHDGRIMVVGGSDYSGDISPDSANRRAEIYDPITDTIERIENYPQPLRAVLDSTRFTEKLDRSNADAVCVYSYQFNFASASWNEGCQISEPNVTILGNEYAPYESFYPDFDNILWNDFLFRDGRPIFLGELSSGDYVYMKHGYFSSTYSDDIGGFPIEENTKIYVVNFRR